MVMRLKDMILLIPMMIHHLKKGSMRMDQREKKERKSIPMKVPYMMERDGETIRVRSTEITFDSSKVVLDI